MFLFVIHPLFLSRIPEKKVACNELDPYERVVKMTEAFMKCARRIHGDDFGFYDDPQFNTF